MTKISPDWAKATREMADDEVEALLYEEPHRCDWLLDLLERGATAIRASHELKNHMAILASLEVTLVEKIVEGPLKVKPARRTASCPECSRVIQVSHQGHLYTHGVIGDRCPGSGTVCPLAGRKEKRR